MKNLVHRYNCYQLSTYLWLLTYWNVSCLSASLSEVNTTELHSIELELVRAVSHFIDLTKENIIEFEDIAYQAKQSGLKQKEHGIENYLGNPVAAFSMVKRFADGWGKLERFIVDEDPATGIVHIV